MKESVGQSVNTFLQPAACSLSSSFSFPELASFMAQEESVHVYVIERASPKESLGEK